MAQQEGRLAKRYARALLDLYPPTELDAISGALATVAATWRENPELREVISNPGISSLNATLDPVDTQYNYFLTDPATGNTIFAKTYEEHIANKVKYGL